MRENHREADKVEKEQEPSVKTVVGNDDTRVCLCLSGVGWWWCMCVCVCGGWGGENYEQDSSCVFILHQGSLCAAS